jgi:hypothetical protein
MTQRCKQIQKDGFHTCGSYAFNLWSEGIDQGDLCDVHYWQQKAQPAPVQEPFCFFYVENGEEYFAPKGAYVPDNAQPLYTTPPAAQRQWVGLTDEEIREVNAKVSQIPPIDYTTTTYARAIEAKLKEKNT